VVALLAWLFLSDLYVTPRLIVHCVRYEKFRRLYESRNVSRSPISFA